MARLERRELLDKPLSNRWLDGLTVRYEIIKPLRTLSEMKENEIWRTGRDSNSRYAINVNSLSKRAPSATRPPVRFRLLGRKTIAWHFPPRQELQAKICGSRPRADRGASEGLCFVGWSNLKGATLYLK